MPKKPVKGTKQVLMELPVQLVDDVKGFAQSRGETFKEVVIEALRRHMAYPSKLKPPPEPPPLPPPEPLPDAVVAVESSRLVKTTAAVGKRKK